MSSHTYIDREAREEILEELRVEEEIQQDMYNDSRFEEDWYEDEWLFQLGQSSIYLDDDDLIEKYEVPDQTFDEYWGCDDIPYEITLWD
jgi:hypothetical protein